MSGHESLVGEDSKVHRLFHDIMNSVHDALSNQSSGVEAADPGNKEVVDDLMFHMSQYVYTAIEEFARHQEVAHGKSATEYLSSSYMHEFVFQVAFQVGMRLNSECRTLFALGSTPFETMTDEKWQEELSLETEAAKKRDETRRRWELEFRTALNMDEETFQKFKSGELAAFALSPENLEKVQHLVKKAPFDLGSGHGHGHGHSASASQPTDDAPTGMYL